MDLIPRTLVHLGVQVARVYNRIEVTRRSALPEGPVLFVANHGFGGIVDLNLLAFSAAYEEIGDTREVTTLTHAMVWKLGIGRAIEPFGARPASRATALDAIAEGHHVLVFPGGDIDALKSFGDRNEVLFSGRSGFARLAMEANVPVVPVVTAGAGETLYVVRSGRRLARWSGVDKLLRLNALPVSVSIPWGVNVGLVGLLPYVPLPAKLATTVLAPMTPSEGESPHEYAERIHGVMQAELNALTKGRIPVIG